MLFLMLVGCVGWSEPEPEPELEPKPKPELETAPITPKQEAVSTVAAAPPPDTLLVAEPMRRVVPRLGPLADLVRSDEQHRVLLQGFDSRVVRRLENGLSPARLVGEVAVEVDLRWNDEWIASVGPSSLPNGNFYDGGWELGEPVIEGRAVTWAILGPELCCELLETQANYSSCVARKPANATLRMERLSSGSDVRVSLCGQEHDIGLVGRLRQYWRDWQRKEAIAQLASIEFPGLVRAGDGSWSLRDEPIRGCTLVVKECPGDGDAVAACSVGDTALLVLDDVPQLVERAGIKKCGVYDQIALP